MSNTIAALIPKIEENVQITSQGIKNSLKKYTALQSISELVWNGFDAGASKIEIDLSLNALGSADHISIKDNGHGIDREKLITKFKPFFQSEKIYDPQIKHSTTHGKNGVGRLTFFACANFASWYTVYQKGDKNYSYTIKISATELEAYRPSIQNVAVGEHPGTTVVLEDIVSDEVSNVSVRKYLALEFCWFLELNKEKKYSIIINGETLTYDDLILSNEHCLYVCDNSKMEFEVRYVCWSEKLSEYSKYYYINSEGEELAKENTTLNNKGDKFYHSVFIQSKLFDKFDLLSKLAQLSYDGTKNRNSDEYRFLMREVNRHLIDLRRPLLKKHVSEMIESLKLNQRSLSLIRTTHSTSIKKAKLKT